LQKKPEGLVNSPLETGRSRLRLNTGRFIYGDEIGVLKKNMLGFKAKRIKRKTVNEDLDLFPWSYHLGATADSPPGNMHPTQVNDPASKSTRPIVLHLRQIDVEPQTLVSI